jgi:hypothetical protein
MNANRRQSSTTYDLRNGDTSINSVAAGSEAWTDFGSLQNTTVSAGDTFLLDIATVTGSVTYLTIQIEVTPS